ncbi:MAG TPA: hypothetical protein VF801_02885 [Rhodocyclaceae bacterium]
MLHALIGLAAGDVLIVAVDPQTRERKAIIFEGQPLPQLMGSLLLRREWIQPRCAHWMPNSSFYELSPYGRAALDAGVRWWRNQPLLRRLVLRLTE